MKKIALILTGGTIGSTIQNHTIDTGNDSIYQLVQTYEATYQEQQIFSVSSPFQELSENFTKKQWQLLYEHLSQLSMEEYEGVIIAHGTDTLAYSAALVGMLFSHVQIPIVLIGSNYPIGQPGSNGLTNLRAAVCFIRQQITPGVFVCYENNHGQVELHLATRLLPADNVLDQYGSFGGPCFAVMERSTQMGEFSFRQNPGTHQPTLSQLQQPAPALLQEQIKLEKDVLFLHPYPGQNYELLQPDQTVGAVYQYLYHAGTICTTKPPYSFLNFVNRCHEKNIPVCAASLKQQTTDNYASQIFLRDHSVLPMYDISPQAGYMKLLIGINQTTYALEDFLKKNCYFETIRK